MRTKTTGRQKIRQAKKPSKVIKVRKCIASGDVVSRDELLRFVVGPDQTIVPDIEAKLPGRGIWLTSSRAALTKAIEKKCFARSTKTAVTVPDGLAELIERLLVERVIQGLALSRRAGSVVSGFGKVETLLRNTPALALLEASDGAADGRRKLTGLAKAWQNDHKTPIPVIGCLNADELGLAFGRGSVIHAALVNTGVAKRVLLDFQRLNGFRPWFPISWDMNN